jgi:hypothetical protein
MQIKQRPGKATEREIKDEGRLFTPKEFILAYVHTVEEILATAL